MIPERVAGELKKIVGEENYLDSPEDVINYSYDAYVIEKLPDAVVLPITTEQVSAIMSVAFREVIPVTPRGAGTNLSGGSVPVSGGLVLALSRMNKILEVRKEDRFAIVQAGVINGDLQAEVRNVGLFYPPDPASMYVSTLGGNVAENAGGPRGVKYGVTRDYLLGLTVVLADGRVIRTGGRTVKNVTGLDLTSIFCGSEGTLGIVTEITVKLLPLPESQRSIQAAFADLDKAGQTVTRIMEAGILPVALELMDSVVINLIEDFAHIGLPRDAEGLLLIMIDGSQESVDRHLALVAQVCREQGAATIQSARTDEENEALWLARRSAVGAMARSRPNLVLEDVTVPVSKLPAMVREIVAIGSTYGITVGVLAHAGDGNMHPLILTDRRDQEEWGRVERAVRQIFERAVALDGTLSGEHGVGLAKEQFLDLVVDKAGRQLMREIKAVFDPKHILNPHKFI